MRSISSGKDRRGLPVGGWCKSAKASPHRHMQTGNEIEDIVSINEKMKHQIHKGLESNVQEIQAMRVLRSHVRSSPYCGNGVKLRWIIYTYIPILPFVSRSDATPGILQLEPLPEEAGIIRLRGKNLFVIPTARSIRSYNFSSMAFRIIKVARCVHVYGKGIPQKGRSTCILFPSVTSFDCNSFSKKGHDFWLNLESVQLFSYQGMYIRSCLVFSKFLRFFGKVRHW